MKNIITLESDANGKRLKYYRPIQVNAEYWDDLWKQSDTTIDYSRSEAGSNTFRKTMARFGAYKEAPQGEFYQYAFSPEEMSAILDRLGFDMLSIRLRGSLKTLRDHTLVGRLPLGPLATPVAVALDILPVTRNWGHSDVWVTRKRQA